MPISINNFTWRQTDDMVFVRVPLENIPHNKVDIFTSDTYIKVHFPPFIFEICLYEEISEDVSKCTLVQGEAVFELVKLQAGVLWPTLNKDISRKQMLQIKEEAIKNAHKKADEENKIKKEMKDKRQKKCVSKQVMLDTQLRERIEGMKKEERGSALKDLMKWKEKDTDHSFLLNPIEKAKSRALSYWDNKKETQQNNEIDECSAKNEEHRASIAPSKDIFTEEDLIRDSGEVFKKVEKKGPAYPPPRTNGKIITPFTFRAFPTPLRESKINEEQEWLKKQAEARKKTGFVAEDLRPEENDPQWLLEKGRSFHQVGNYLGAISAFTHAIQTWDQIPELYVYRSDSHLAIGNLRRALRDTSIAIELLKPHVTSNLELRFKAHLNRGRALILLEQPSSAMAELTEALELRPNHGEVINLMDTAENMIQNPPPPPPEKKQIETEDLTN